MNDELVKLSLESTVTPFGASRRYDAMKCPRAARLRSQGVELKERPEYFEIGSLVHSALAYVSLGAMRGLELDYNDPLDMAAAAGRPPHLVAQVRSLMSAYFDKWGAANAGYQSAAILDVEVFLGGAVQGEGPAVAHTGRADAIIAIGQQVAIVDHKTAASMPSMGDAELAAQYRTRPQFLGLAYAYRQMKGEVPSILVNRIVKTKTPQFRRIFVDFTEKDLDNWGTEHAKMVKWLEAAGDFANYSACAPEGAPRCTYFTHCHGTEEDRTATYRLPEEAATNVWYLTEGEVK